MARRVVTYLSDEQYAGFIDWIEQRDLDEATAIRMALTYFLLRHDFGAWPDNDPERGGKREGAGRKRKAHEPSENGGSNT